MSVAGLVPASAGGVGKDFIIGARPGETARPAAGAVALRTTAGVPLPRTPPGTEPHGVGAGGDGDVPPLE